MRKLLLTLALALLPASGLAHAMLDGATPAVGSSVPPTDTIRLRYTEGVEARFSSVTVSPDGGTPLPSAKAEVDPADNKVLTLHLAGMLTPGRYRVDWHIVSVDSHRTEGSFTFTVSP
jgi:methionine-rich copper-binding protein CopC